MSAPPVGPGTCPPSAAAPRLVALGEVMLRLDPGTGRIRTARHFEAHEGGGEYNVARTAHALFGVPAAIVTALVDDEIGQLLASQIRGSGVDTSLVRWISPHARPPLRNGLNFTERGFGCAGAVGVSDRGSTAASTLEPADVDWHRLFASGTVEWFHTGGIFASLSDSCEATARHAMSAARSNGVTVSFDTNYRASLWADRGGREAAASAFRALAATSDVLIGSAWDLFPDSPPMPRDLAGAAAVFTAGVERIRTELPSLRVMTTTRRAVHSASRNGWGAFGWSADSGAVVERGFEDLQILDRVGGGDAFAAGLVSSLMDQRPLAEALRVGVASGAYAVTTPGDVSQAHHHEVLQLAAQLRPGSAARASLADFRREPL